MREYPDDALLEAENNLESAQSAYLRKSGWTHSSDHPGSLWLWSKVIEGREYTVSTGIAIHMQRYLDPDGIKVELPQAKELKE